MREVASDLGGIVFLEPGDDTTPAYDLLRSRTPASVDTETTGLDPYAPDFRVRLVQFGSAAQAYVFRPHDFPQLARDVFTTRPVFLHNATYDLLSIERELGVPFAESAACAVDTGILSRLLDPRPAGFNAPGHDLKGLCASLFKLDTKDARKEVVAAGRAYKLKKDDVWAGIPDTDETYVRYAGQDVLLTSRLGERLSQRVKREGLGWLATFEHKLAYDLAHLQRKGMAIDVEWINDARARFALDYETHEKRLRDDFGIVKSKTAKSYSAASGALIAKMIGLGAKWDKTTDSGKPSLDAGVLKLLSQHGSREVSELATCVLAAKQAAHYGEGYLAGFLNARGYDGRVHPQINPLAAITGRMSITNPPLQQIPRDEVTLRGSFLPDDGHVLVSADYSQMEWRVAAAISGDPALTAAIMRGDDIHDNTARALFGDGFTKAQRTIAKIAGLAWLYGSGVSTIATQCGVSEAQARKLRARLAAEYKGIAKSSAMLKERVDAGQIVQRSATGRVLHIDRGYAAFNSHVQSPSRDLFAEAVVKLFDAGLGDAMRLVVHDEIILSVPAELAEDAKRVLESCMNTEFRGVPITAEAEIMGERWKK